MKLLNTLTTQLNTLLLLGQLLPLSGVDLAFHFIDTLYVVRSPDFISVIVFFMRGH